MNELHTTDNSRDLILENEGLGNCQACAPKRIRPAVGRTKHPDYRHLAFCAECLAFYNEARLEWVDIS